MEMQTQERTFEDFEVGQVIRHTTGRTIIPADNIWFTLLTNNTNPIHFDVEYAKKTEFKRPLVNSCFTLALTVGLSVQDISRNAINLGWETIELPHPVFDGDTLYAQTEILDKRESKSRPHMGIVWVKTLGYNQEGTVVIRLKRSIMVYKKSYAPSLSIPGPKA
jgi:acyl dehydratase